MQNLINIIYYYYYYYYYYYVLDFVLFLCSCAVAVSGVLCG